MEKDKGLVIITKMKRRQQAQRHNEVAGRGKEAPRRSSAIIPIHVKGRVVRYGECQKNHAANIGGFAVDGCREFMTSMEEGEDANGALTCAACGCHRNFHRREIEVEDSCECSSHSSTVK